MPKSKSKAKYVSKLPWLPTQIILGCVLTLASMCFIVGSVLAGTEFLAAAKTATSVALFITVILTAKSLRDFSQTGPRVRREIIGRYRGYAMFAMARLATVAFGIILFSSFPGAILTIGILHTQGAASLGSEFTIAGASVISVILASSSAFFGQLLHNPGLVVASWQYRVTHLHRLWMHLSPKVILVFQWTISITTLTAVSGIVINLITIGENQLAIALELFCVGYASIIVVASLEQKNIKQVSPDNSRPNIVLIGSDTLRADRIGLQRNGKSLTPQIDALLNRGIFLSNCYVPCARTAPSLISLLTGTWPHHHGIRDNFVTSEETRLKVPALPELLKTHGYRTAAVSDWCGADLGKFSFGFDFQDLPDDQWNLRYLIRQGPKDIRLFLSIFLHNRIGRHLLPEIYYLGGVPQTRSLGHRGRSMLARLGAAGDPFLLNIFFSTTHPPFASEYPYYLHHSNPTYVGESKFAMARLTEPFEIIRRQGEPREEFDLDQILALYDGCVAQFDAEVGKLITHLEQSGLAENTIVVLYSDHGMEFFEHGSWGQGNSAVGDFSARIPLLIFDPRRSGSRRIDGVVRSIDILPTLLEILDLPPVPCDGVSLHHLFKDDTAPSGLPAFSETGVWIAHVPGQPPNHLTYPELFDLLDVPDDRTGTLALKKEFQEQVVVAKDRMIRDGRWKLVYQPLEQGFQLALYDVTTDPGCTIDLSPSQPDEVRRLWSALSAWIDADPIMQQHPRWQNQKCTMIETVTHSLE